MKTRKRTLIKCLSLGGLLASEMPAKWVKPIAKTVLLPAHATTSRTIIGTNLQITEETGGTVEIYTDSTFTTRIFPGEDVGSSYVMLFRTNPVLQNTQINITTRVDGEVVNAFSAMSDGSGVAAVQVGQVGESLLSTLDQKENASYLASLNPISAARAQVILESFEEIRAEADNGNFLAIFLYTVAILAD